MSKGHREAAAANSHGHTQRQQCALSLWLLQLLCALVKSQHSPWSLCGSPASLSPTAVNITLLLLTQWLCWV